MNKGTNKYRRNQESRRKAEPVVEMEALMGPPTEPETEFEDRVVLSEEAAERLANEAILEDGDLEIESLLENKGTEPAKAAAATRLPNPPLGNREDIIIEYAPLIKYIAQKIAARLPANMPQRFRKR